MRAIFFFSSPLRESGRKVCRGPSGGCQTGDAPASFTQYRGNRSVPVIKRRGARWSRCGRRGTRSHASDTQVPPAERSLTRSPPYPACVHSNATPSSCRPTPQITGVSIRLGDEATDHRNASLSALPRIHIRSCAGRQPSSDARTRR